MTRSRRNVQIWLSKDLNPGLNSGSPFSPLQFWLGPRVGPVITEQGCLTRAWPAGHCTLTTSKEHEGLRKSEETLLIFSTLPLTKKMGQGEGYCSTRRFRMPSPIASSRGALNSDQPQLEFSFFLSQKLCDPVQVALPL